MVQIWAARRSVLLDRLSNGTTTAHDVKRHRIGPFVIRRLVFDKRHQTLPIATLPHVEPHMFKMHKSPRTVAYAPHLSLRTQPPLSEICRLPHSPTHPPLSCNCPASAPSPLNLSFSAIFVPIAAPLQPPRPLPS